MKYFQRILFILLLSPAWLSAQLPSLPSKKDSIITHAPDPLSEKRFNRAASELILANLIPWTYDKYLMKKNSADITFKSVEHNLNPENWGWDDGDFATNQLAHPFHGSTFFNAYRANGYNFWQSIPGTFAGSYIWETAAESLDFSVNDFVNTSYGGVIIGEMTHRLANRILSHRSTGIKRQAKEVFALVINPVNGLNRLLDGKWGKLQSGSALPDTSRLCAELDIGVRSVSVNNKDVLFRWYGHIKLLYGTPFDDLRTPFSYLGIDAEFGKNPSDILNQISIYGSLSGWKIGSGAKYKHAGILTANYEYLNNDFFSYSAQSIKFNLLSEGSISSQFKLHTAVSTGPILLAAVPDPYQYKGRFYSYCSGVGFGVNGQISYKTRLFYGVNYRYGVFKTLSGNSSYYILHSLTSEIRYRYTKELSVCAEPGYLALNGKYKYYNDVNNKYPYLRLSMRYMLDYR